LICSKLTLNELFSHLLAYDERNAMLENQPNDTFETSANAASRQYRPRPYGGSRGGRRDERREDRRDDRRDEGFGKE
jgi:hypothetical protein